jgi:predicted O-methyltransferase YrrM
VGHPKVWLFVIWALGAASPKTHVVVVKEMTDRSTLLRAIETSYDFARQNIELSGCYYGEPFRKGPFVDKPCSYYFFLAGLVAQLRCSRILELGTHFGGSIFSMARGIEYSGLTETAEVITVDVKDSNSEAFRANQLVTRILGDCLDDGVAQHVKQSFSGPVDLIYIDAVHDYEHTNRYLQQYSLLVSPRLVILDDIRLNPSMRRFWKYLVDTHGDRVIDITDYSHREQNVGFGLLICDLVQNPPS